MGSQTLTAITEQKGNIETNPEGLVPEVSRPIEQLVQPFGSNVATSKPLQQRIRSVTRPGGHGDSEYSTPIEQLGDFIHAPALDPEQDHLIVQNLLVTANHPNSPISPKAQTPVQQLEFVTNDNTSIPVQQFITATIDDTTSRPIEQTDVLQNIVNITQFNFVELIFPPCNSIKNAVDSNILWRVRDTGFTYDKESLIFKVNGIEVQDDPEFSVIDITNGIQIFYDPPVNFDFESAVTILFDIDDTAVPANHVSVSCVWYTVPDVRPPFFRNVSPVCDSTDVDSLAPVYFDVLDLGEGVDPDSIRVSIEGITVCSGVVLDPITTQDFVTVSGIPQGAVATGYHVTYTHPDDPWRYGSNVSMTFEARDLSDQQNRALFICCFQVEDSAAPVFVNPSPEPCDSFIDNRTGLYFEVYGVEHGVDISTLEVRVDNTLRKVFVRPRILRAE
jgi:hypothetical protein